MQRPPTPDEIYRRYNLYPLSAVKPSYKLEKPGGHAFQKAEPDLPLWFWLTALLGEPLLLLTFYLLIEGYLK